MKPFYKVRKHSNYKTRWICEIFTDNLKNPNKGCDFGRKFSSVKKAEKFGEWACKELSK
jgi:hypothetical protein